MAELDARNGHISVSEALWVERVGETYELMEACASCGHAAALGGDYVYGRGTTIVATMRRRTCRGCWRTTEEPTTIRLAPAPAGR